MPRRPPKKPDPLLDLSGHLLVLQALPIPLDPNTLFIRRAPIELEVGSGKGLFLSSASAAAPERNFLGAEIVAGYARLCAGKLARINAPNARMIHGNALFLVHSMLPDACHAAAFLHHFAGHVPWAHLDIAGMEWRAAADALAAPTRPLPLARASLGSH